MKKETVEIQKELFAAKKSAGQKYCDLIIGRRGLWPLLKYEFTMLLCQNMPGALGLLLRSKLYPCLMKRCGRNVHFGMGVILRHPHKIEIGDNVVVDDLCVLDAKGFDNDGIRIGSGVFIGRGSIMSCKNGNIVLEDNVNIGFNCEIFSASDVVVGSSTLMAAYTYLVGGDHDMELAETSVLDQGRHSRGIRVGSGCWLGAGVKVMDGVSLGAQSILGAGAVVTHDVPEYKVAVGIPARVVRDRREKTDRAPSTSGN